MTRRKPPVPTAQKEPSALASDPAVPVRNPHNPPPLHNDPTWIKNRKRLSQLWATAALREVRAIAEAEKAEAARRQAEDAEKPALEAHPTPDAAMPTVRR